MEIRTYAEELERQILSPRACLAAQSKGRAVDIPPCPMRTCFQRDVDRVIHCKAFRRLMHKTQVFLQPEGDHYRTRMTHTLEVSGIARSMARALRLNQDLTEAAALAHDLGHTPFGHAGERALSRMVEGGFRHYEQSLRVVDRLERDGAGLNLCYEVRDGILRHTTGPMAETLEGQLVRYADKIAYINHDIDDAMRGGIIYPTARSPTSTTTLTTPCGAGSSTPPISPWPSPRCWASPTGSALSGWCWTLWPIARREWRFTSPRRWPRPWQS